MVDIADTFGIPEKGIRSLIVLVVWELWNERNARVSRHREASNISLLNEIKGHTDGLSGRIDASRLPTCGAAGHLQRSSRASSPGTP
jgi:hypothetical protein